MPRKFSFIVKVKDHYQLSLIDYYRSKTTSFMLNEEISSQRGIYRSIANDTSGTMPSNFYQAWEKSRPRLLSRHTTEDNINNLKIETVLKYYISKY